MSFSKIADVYDRFNDLSVYENWVDFTLNSLKRKPQTMLDLACGTGWFTQLMIPFVDSIVGVDIDEAMLIEARKEVPQVPSIQFIQGDMTNLPAGLEAFDLVTCYLDSLCFLDDFQAVEQSLNEMYRVLAKQGTLLFDVWTPYQVAEGFDRFEYFDQDDTATLIWESESDPSSLKVSHYLTVYRQIKDQQFERVDVQLNERTYTLNAYLNALIKAGFDSSNIEVFVDYGNKYYDEELDTTADRWFFRCTK